MRLSIFDDTVGLCLRQRKLFIAVFIGIVQSGFFPLLGGFHSLESFHDFGGRRLGILDRDIYQLDTDILFAQTLQNHFFDGGLNFIFSGSQDIVHRITADHGTDTALADVTQDQYGILGCIDSFYRVTETILYEEIDVDKIIVGSDHERIVGFRRIGIYIISQGKSLNGGIDFADLLDERYLKMKSWIRYRFGLT